MNDPRSTDWHVENPLYAADLRQARQLHVQSRQSIDNTQDLLIEFLSTSAFLEQKKWRLRMSAAVAITTLDEPQLTETLQVLDASVPGSTWKHSGNPVGSQMMPLTCSVQFAKIDALNFLLSRLNPNDACVSGQTALSSALQCGWEDGAKRLAPLTDLRSVLGRRPYLEVAMLNDDAEQENWRVSLIEHEMARRASLRESRAFSTATPAAATGKALKNKKTI